MMLTIRRRTRLAALCGAALLITGAQQALAVQALPGHSPGATIVVNDSDGIGKMHDGKLSLAEAIELANGTLSLSALDADERAQVSGNPGASSPDLIQIAVSTVTVPFIAPSTLPATPGPSTDLLGQSDLFHHPQPSPLPPLVGNDEDTIDGQGAILRVGPAGGPVGDTGLVIGSSNLTVRDIRFQQFINTIELTPQNANGLHNVAITGNRFEDTGQIYGVAVTDAGVRSIIDGLTISDNVMRFDDTIAANWQSQTGMGTPPYAIMLFGIPSSHNATADGQADRPAELRNVNISGNVITNRWEAGMWIYGMSPADTVNKIQNSEIDNLTISGNYISNSKTSDNAIGVWGGSGAFRSSNARLDNVDISNNFVQGGAVQIYTAVFEAGLALDATNSIGRGLRIEGNHTVSDLGTSCMAGILVSSALSEIYGGVETGIGLRDVSVSGNNVESCDKGIIVSPALKMGDSGDMLSNWMTNVAVTGNNVSKVTNGVIVSAGMLIPWVGVPNYPSSNAAQNYMTDVTVENNTVSASGAGIRLHGGYAESNYGGIVVDNTLNNAIARDNRVTAPTACIASADGSADTASGVTVTQNNLNNGSCQ